MFSGLGFKGLGFCRSWRSEVDGQGRESGKLAEEIR